MSYNIIHDNNEPNSHPQPWNNVKFNNLAYYGLIRPSGITPAVGTVLSQTSATTQDFVELSAISDAGFTTLSNAAGPLTVNNNGSGQTVVFSTILANGGSNIAVWDVANQRISFPVAGMYKCSISLAMEYPVAASTGTYTVDLESDVASVDSLSFLESFDPSFINYKDSKTFSFSFQALAGSHIKTTIINPIASSAQILVNNSPLSYFDVLRIL